MNGSLVINNKTNNYVPTNVPGNNLCLILLTLRIMFCIILDLIRVVRYLFNIDLSISFMNTL